MKPTLPRGLYVITDPDLIRPEQLGNAVQHAILGGAKIVQYRDKSGQHGRRVHEAAMLRDICHDHGVLFIVNDDARLAEEVHADGVHLGKDDRAIPAVRQLLGERALIGASCYNSLARAVRAQNEGADYVAFGSFFHSNTKPTATLAHASLLSEAAERLRIPIVAIGGVTPANGGTLIRLGAHMLAVVSGVFQNRDAESAAHHYAVLFDRLEAVEDRV